MNKTTKLKLTKNRNSKLAAEWIALVQAGAFGHSKSQPVLTEDTDMAIWSKVVAKLKENLMFLSNSKHKDTLKTYEMLQKGDIDAVLTLLACTAYLTGITNKDTQLEQKAYNRGLIDGIRQRNNQEGESWKND